MTTADKKTSAENYIEMLENKENERLAQIQEEKDKAEETRKLKDKLHDAKVEYARQKEEQERAEREAQERIDRERKEREDREHKTKYKQYSIDLLNADYKKEITTIRDRCNHSPDLSKKLIEKTKKELFDNVRFLNDGNIDIMHLATVKAIDNKVFNKK